MILYADSNDLATQLAAAVGRDVADVVTDEERWPVVGSSVVALSSLSQPLLLHLLRLCISNVDKGGVRLGVVRKQWEDGDEDKLLRLLRAEYAAAHAHVQVALQNTGALPPTAWREERIQQLHRWKTIPMIEYSTFTMGPGLKKELDAFFEESSGPSYSLAGPTEELTAKPPNLHWTPVALEGDVEVAIWLKFTMALPERRVLSSLARHASKYFPSVYEWTEGVLISNESVRVHVQRTAPLELAIAGRICYEEVDDIRTACGLLWSAVALAASHIYASLAESPHLHYTHHIALIGKVLFKPEIDSRVFELTTFFNTATKFGKVGFHMDNDKSRVYEVLLGELFPGGVPTSASSFSSLASSMSPLLPSPAPVSSPVASSSLSVPHGRGRRVSFGAIRTVGEAVDDYVDCILKESLDHAVHS